MSSLRYVARPTSSRKPCFHVYSLTVDARSVLNQKPCHVQSRAEPLQGLAMGAVAPQALSLRSRSPDRFVIATVSRCRIQYYGCRHCVILCVLGVDACMSVRRTVGTRHSCGLSPRGWRAVFVCVGVPFFLASNGLVIVTSPLLVHYYACNVLLEQTCVTSIVTIAVPL